MRQPFTCRSVTYQHTPSKNRFFKRNQHRFAQSSGLIACLSLVSLALVGCGNDEDSIAVDNTLAASTPAQVVISDAKLLAAPVVTQNFSASELKQAAIDAGLVASLSTDPVCGVSIQYVNHTTTGLKNEATNATGAVMVPDGEAKACQGERPIMLYAHGTSPYQSYNLAALNDPLNPAYKEALLLAMNFAGRGDIVVAPNYPGYDASTLDYAPYITLKQGQQMLDGLQAGRLAIAELNDPSTKAGLNSVASKSVTTSKQAVPAMPKVSAGDKVFITGYSQGGYVAMAAAKALDDLGVPATAISPASGPYAVAAFADSIMSGRTIYGGTVFLPMLTNSYAKQYAATYPNLINGVFAPKFTGAANLFPSNDNIVKLFLQGKLPTTQLFESAPAAYPQLSTLSPPTADYSFGFGANNYLFATPFRDAYVQDMLAHPDSISPTFVAATAGALPQSKFAIRQAFIENDLRGYLPKSPTLLCGGHQDSSVTYDVNAEALAKIWQSNNPTVRFALVDVDMSNAAARSAQGKSAYISTLPTSMDATIQQAASEVQTVFSHDLDALLTETGDKAYASAIDKGKSVAEATAAREAARAGQVLTSYHGMVAPYCLNAANAFFDQYR